MSDSGSAIAYADLELGLHRRGEGGYVVELRLSLPGDATDKRSVHGASDLRELSHEALLEAALDTNEYGRRLTSWLFADPGLKADFLKARSSAGDALRLRLLVGPGAPELRGLRWETLRDPEFDVPLFGGDRVVFSRYLSSLDWRPEHLRPHGRLRALVAIAAPSDLGQFKLAPLDAAAELARAGQALAGVEVVPLGVGEGPAKRASLANLDACLRDGFDLLYLVAHGSIVDDKPVLWLEDKDGKVSRVSGDDLVRTLWALRDRSPVLAVLASCQSAGALAALGPLLAERAVPAVVAMQGNVAIETVEQFMPIFFRELLRDGQIDRAMAAARGALLAQPACGDWWMPTLFMRLRGGRLWAEGAESAIRAAERGLIAAGLPRLAEAVSQYAPDAPALRLELAGYTAALQPALANQSLPLDLVALRAVERICAEVLDLEFAELAGGRSPAPYAGESPFQGLTAFHARDRRYFFGRDKLVDDLRRRLAEHRFLAVLGPSGSGKSSLVLAGLLPILQKAEPTLYIPNEPLRPGATPLARLRAALADDPALLVVDQFEEVFTHCDDEDQRRAFFAELLAEVDRRRVVLTMRADFWGDCAPYELLRREMQEHQELIAPLGPDELGLAIEQQASAGGLRFEADLVNTIVDAVRGQPGAMPLVQYALKELWRHRHGRWLRTSEYRALGGVQEAIARSADTFFDNELRPAEQAAVRAIFARLTRLDEDPAPGVERRDTRQRLAIAELAPQPELLAATHHLVSRLATAGLVVTSSRPGAGSGEYEYEVEVAHEALLRHWQRLRDWINEDRPLLRLLAVVRSFARDWEQHPDEDKESYLMQGRRLEEALALLVHPRVQPNPAERRYLEACRERERRQGQLLVTATIAATLAGPDAGLIEIALQLPGETPALPVGADLAVGRATIELDRPALRAAEADVAYGDLLSQSFYAAQELAAPMRQALAAQTPERPLVVRWLIDANAPALHTLGWETLRGPDGEQPLAAGEQVFVSRLVDSDAARLRPLGSLRALVLIAGAADHAAEAARATARLGPIPAVVASPDRSTLSGLAGHLRDGYDLLYLAAPAELVRGEPCLLLSNDLQGTASVSWADLSAFLRGSSTRMVVLAGLARGEGAAGRGDGGAPGALAASLVGEGLLAALVVPAAAEPTPLDAMLSSFFQELARDGQFERALARARAGAQGCAGWWRPALYTCSERGILGYRPGFSVEPYERYPRSFVPWSLQEDDSPWLKLYEAMRTQKVVPVLGPGLSERYLGSRRDLARAWATRHNLGALAIDQADLTEVAQQLAVNLGPDALHRLFIDDLYARLGAHVSGGLPADRPPELGALSTDEAADVLNRLALDVYRARVQTDPHEPHRILAALPLAIYITTGPDDLLAAALTDAGRGPVVEICPWRKDATWPSIYDQDPRFQPSVARPLIFHLYGHVRVPDSLALSEGELFAHLIQAAGNPDIVPRVLRAALAQSQLLILGHREQERVFQFLARIILDLDVFVIARRPGRASGTHIIQMEPEIGRAAERRQRYQQRYFDSYATRVYSGSVEDFIAGLTACLESEGRADAGAGVADQRAQPAEPPPPAPPTRRRPAPKAGRPRQQPPSAAVEAPTTMSGPARLNPYVGPRPFRAGEALYGREYEALTLAQLLASSQVVVLYGPAGAGRSSLIHAGLIPRLERQGLRVLPPIRLSYPPPALAEQANRYVMSALLSLSEGLPEARRLPPAALARLSLAEGLERLIADDEYVLIFDQFEEIVTRDPTDIAAKKEFFAQLGKVLGGSRCVALFSLREEHLGAVEALAHRLPGGFKTRFRLEPLQDRDALQTVIAPARELGIDFTEGAARRLIDELRRVVIQQPDGSSAEALGPYVSPVEIQLVCRSLWERLGGQATSITEADLAGLSDVKQALASYYADQVAQAAAETGVAEQAIRDWFEHELISPQGLRNQVMRQAERSAGLDNRAIDRLADSYLVQTEERRGAIWLELASDRMLQPILANNAAWRAAQA